MVHPQQFQQHDLTRRKGQQGEPADMYTIFAIKLDFRNQNWPEHTTTRTRHRPHPITKSYAHIRRYQRLPLRRNCRETSEKNWKNNQVSTVVEMFEVFLEEPLQWCAVDGHSLSPYARDGQHIFPPVRPKVAELCAKAGAILLYLPPCSPDLILLNPIGEFFAELENLRRKRLENPRRFAPELCMLSSRTA